MKVTLVIVSVLLVLAIIGLFLLAQQSRVVPKLGLIEGNLMPCTIPSNCVSSTETQSLGVAPIPFNGEASTAWIQMHQAIEAVGGMIEQKKENYLWATFRSPLFGFVDDVEILMDEEHQLFNIRSASRVGRSDFSVNRQRIEVLQQAFKNNQATKK